MDTVVDTKNRWNPRFVVELKEARSDEESCHALLELSAVVTVHPNSRVLDPQQTLESLDESHQQDLSAGSAASA